MDEAGRGMKTKAEQRHRAAGWAQPRDKAEPVSPSSSQLLLPGGTYLSPSHGRGPPPARRGARAGRASPPAARCWPPPLPEPGPGGAGGAEPVTEPGGGGCPERAAHHHPHEPGAGRRAEPSAGPAGLLPLLRGPPAPAKPSLPWQEEEEEGAPHQHPHTGGSLPDLGAPGAGGVSTVSCTSSHPCPACPRCPVALVRLSVHVQDHASCRRGARHGQRSPETCTTPRHPGV